MKTPRRILLMYISPVSGHRQATMAIETSLKQLMPGVEIMSINGFGYTYPILEKVVNRAYMGVIKRTPKLWEMMYDNPKLVKRSAKLKDFLHKTSHKKLEALFKKFQPDTVVCTQAFPCGMVADFKNTHNLPMTLIGVLTDHAPHRFWLNEGVDFYVVPSEDAKERFIKENIPPEAIRVYGIPIDLKFTKKHDKKIIAQNLGLQLSVPTILIMGGGQGLGPIKDAVKSLLRSEMNLQLIVLAGTNKKLLKWLERIQKKSTKKIIFSDYVTNVDELMEISTLIVSKPGGLTTSEVVAKGLPMIVINPLPGQEMYNTKFLTKKGIAIYVENVKDIHTHVEALLRDPQRLKMMSQAAGKEGRPWAADEIAKLILNHPPRLAAHV